jgi:hypothetical protein
MPDDGEWVPFAEPWRTTLVRTGLIALAVGAGAGVVTRRLLTVPSSTLAALWVSVGGHFVELLFRNYLRRYLSSQASIQAVARIAYWYLAGLALYAGCLATRAILSGRTDLPLPWWTAGLFFVGLELLVHLMLWVRKQPSFYDGRG